MAARQLRALQSVSKGVSAEGKGKTPGQIESGMRDILWTCFYVLMAAALACAVFILADVISLALRLQ